MSLPPELGAVLRGSSRFAGAAGRCGCLPGGVGACRAVWVPARQCGCLPGGVGACRAVWVPAGQCGCLPGSVGACRAGPGSPAPAPRARRSQGARRCCRTSPRPAAAASRFCPAAEFTVPLPALFLACGNREVSWFSFN